MKKLLLLAILLSFGLCAYSQSVTTPIQSNESSTWEPVITNPDGNSIAPAQEQKELARFYVTHATENGQDITEWSTYSKAFTVFYTIGNELYMANVSENNNEQSWGKIWGFENKTKEETSTEYKADIFYFNWNYSNNYDTKSGTCKAQFFKIYKPQGIVSKLKLVTESLDIIEYTGYMDGSIDFPNY